MNIYPPVLGESKTLDRVLAGASLARYGDGEFTLAEGRSIINQPRADLRLCARLRGILLGEGAPCLIGIPNILSKTPKAAFWAKYRARGAALLNQAVPYVSSFITRPDSAPWIDTDDYWARLERIWAAKDVTLVRGTDPERQPKNPAKLTGAISLLAKDLKTARSVTEVVGPSVDAWAVYDALLEQIGTPETAILCLGPTATVMAVDLCAKGVHAIDLGHVGLFLHRRAKGLTMTRTAAEKMVLA